MFPKTVVQTCIVHLIRHSMQFASWKEHRAVAAALKPIYQAESAAAARERLEDFDHSPWGQKYPAIAQSWRRNWEHVIAFFAFAPEVRKILYTTNAIESLNAQVRSRRIVGWAMETHLRTELALNALDMALGQRRPAGVIHHSDQGSQYTSLAFGKRCEQAGGEPRWVRSATASTTPCARASSPPWNANCSTAAISRPRPRRAFAVFDFIEGSYNPHRRHSALDYRSPINYERSHSAQADYRSPTPSTETGYVQLQ